MPWFFGQTAHFRFIPTLVNKPSVSISVSGSTVSSSSAAAAVTILKLEPGATWACVALLKSGEDWSARSEA